MVSFRGDKDAEKCVIWKRIWGLCCALAPVMNFVHEEVDFEPTAERCNTSNFWRYSPFIVSRGKAGLELCVDCSFFDTLLLETAEVVRQICRQNDCELVLANVTTPHGDVPEADRLLRRVWLSVYTAFIDQFDFDVWYPWLEDMIHDVSIVRLDSCDIIALEEAFRLFHLTGRWRLDSLDLAPASESALSAAIARHRPAFVRTVKTSGKNTRSLRPCETYRDVLQHLASCGASLVPSTADGRLAVVLMDWNGGITADNEFRVIVHGRKIRAISQQKWFLRIPRVRNVRGLVEAIDALYKEIASKWPLPDVVLDVWVSCDSCGDSMTAHLIECNPGGMWASSGSSLFNWEADGIESMEEVHLRTYSACE